MEKQDISFVNQCCRFAFRVGALIVSNGNLLMIKHVDIPGYYTVGGNVKYNETTEQAVIREAFEETGVKFKINRLAFVHEYFLMADNKKNHQLVFFYLMKEKNIIKLIPENDYETLHWIPLNKLKDTHTYPDFLKAELIENLGGIGHIVGESVIN